MKTVGAKLHEEDIGKLKQKADELGISVSSLIRLLIWDFLEKESSLESELSEINRRNLQRCEYLERIYSELGKIGGNVNQIAYVLNSSTYRVIDDEERKKILEVAEETLELLNEIKEMVRWRS
jgi:phosphatidylserine/phosphatidylglycerophosphate/cardiolipin synthase-like enzyme